MKFSKRKICQVLALLISGMSATAAVAASPLVQGGGSILVAPMIGAIGNTTTEIGLFGTAEATFTYYSAGQIAGQIAFLNNQPARLSANLTGTVDFGNSDVSLSTAGIASYLAGLGTTNGPLIQIPYIVIPIAISLVNGPAVTSTTTPQTTPNQAHSIALNDDDLCGIFSGKLADWNQVTNPETGLAYALNAPITVIYPPFGPEDRRLSRHLAAVCTPSNTASGVTFAETGSLAALFPKGVPANFVGATDVRSALLSSSGAAVAYLSPDYTNTYLAPLSTIATASGAGQLSVASLVNTIDGKYYAPTYANAATALGTAAAPNNKTAASDPVAWVPNIGNPAAGYPVVGTSQIVLSQCYKDPNVKTALHDFLSDHYTNASFASIVHGNGFGTIPSNFQTAISNDFLSNASGYNLDIGNASVCTGTVVGR
ncbi:TPA: substrate-binding domain-containing protein [Burkholderia cenocepacia]|uniref:substrate-binding domain-containing protein n=1 Tax=unclassified Burkholderia TaxID=2613784 RepID=UPI00158BBDC1|nr:MULTISPECIES: substrate-binding domain-containing protein [unclassified Burkholderia]HEF5873224.1 substrate-binding domain-containing protein [Burkholderia cenocepacia]